MSFTPSITFIHPVFQTTQQSSLFAVEGDNAMQMTAFLRRQIYREPQNLKLHVQHIFHLIQQDNVSRDDMLGALVDLFMVLAEKGQALRKRMLYVAKPFLLAEDVQFFLTHFATGITKRTLCFASGNSVLSENYIGSATAIQKCSNTSNPQTLSSYEEALELIDQGDLTEAAKLLLIALKQQPTNQQMAHELLTIYQHYDDSQAIESVRDWYFANDLELPESWPLL